MQAIAGLVTIAFGPIGSSRNCKGEVGMENAKVRDWQYKDIVGEILGASYMRNTHFPDLQAYRNECSPGGLHELDNVNATKWRGDWQRCHR